MGNYISYFKESIKNSDIRKAKDLLIDLHLESDDTKTAILNELAMVSDEMACLLLDFIMRLEIKYYKSFKLELYDKLIQLITDRAHLNFDFAIIFYKIRDRKKILQATSLLKYILTNCTDREILFETINAVGTEKIESLVPAIAEFLYYDDASLKEQAIRNLSKFASPEVYKILLDTSKTVKNDQDIMNALELFKIPSKAAPIEISAVDSPPPPIPTPPSTVSSDFNAEKLMLNSINELVPEQLPVTPTSDVDSVLSPTFEFKADNIFLPDKKIDTKENPTSESQQHDIKKLGSKSIEERFEAFGYFFNSGSKHFSSGSMYLKELISNLKSQDHDLIINTLRIISNIESEELLPDIYSFLNRKNLEPSLEHEAFETLYSFDKFSFTELMMDAIEKPAIHVRMSAVKALDKNDNDPVYAKIKNRIETGREKGLALVHTIIDAHAENLISYLLVSDTFADIASTYLTKDATPSALNTYLNILTNRGLKSTAKKIQFKADMENRLKNRFKAMVISPSDTVHKIYEKLLFKNGYISTGFQNPEDAFESLSIDKPDLIVSDLFSKDMTALDFAREVREFYTKNDLPFLISTPQNDFLNINFTKHYADCDINGIFKFPGIIKGINELIN
ncbi:MAG: hypothetical protein HQK62_10810 [Desulfamplus sp.]|nr:hypothetical protein [Desulfamplus sp.]MBF0259310.1 hypothetical protein [Desulfamplus sp.]